MATSASVMPTGRELHSNSLSNLEVMVVDDETDIRDLLPDHLQDSHGLIVTAMPDGQAAVAALERSNGRFGLVLTDINMPGADGFEVLRAARQANAAAAVVMITGYGSGASAEQASAFGARNFLRKPFKLGDLDLILRGIGDRLALHA